MGAGGEVECGRGACPNLRWIADRPGRFGHRFQQRNMVELLQGSAAPPVLRGSSADQHQRAAVHPGTGDGADGIRDTWAGSYGSKARAASEFSDGFSGEDRGLLVADIDQPQRPGALGGAGTTGLLNHSRCHPLRRRIAERCELRKG